MPRFGSFPTSYRGGGRSGQSALRNFWQDTRGYLGPAGPLPQQLSPNPWRPVPVRPFGRPPAPGPFVPANPNNPLGPPDIDLPLEPAISPGTLSAEVVVGRLAPWALLALQLYDMVIPSGGRNFAMPPSNWVHVCGPFGYPGPPYRNCVNWTWNGSVSVGGCIVPLPGQALTINNSFFLPPFGDPAHTIIYAYGPNEALLPTERWYTYDQWSAPAPGPVNPPGFNIMLGVAPVSLPHELLPFVGPAVLVNPLPVAPPVGHPPTPDQQRGYITDLEPAVDPHPKPGDLGVSHVPKIPDTRPRPREREHKAAGSAARGFQILSQLGSWNSLVHALHRSLPKDCRARGRNTGAQIAALYKHASCLELGAAAWELSNFWVRYKFAGWSYGRIQRYMVRMDPSGSLFRNFMTFMDLREHFGEDKVPRPRARRPRDRGRRSCPGC